MFTKRVRETDERTLRKRRMRLFFKKLVRIVMLNRQMLDETEEQPGISMNVKKNVALLVRQKRKTGLLTVAEKALLRSPHSYRTIEERRKLCMIIANMPCFVKLPPKIRARLVPIIKYTTINADRVIVKEGDLPIYVYFVVSGEIEMMKNTYDKVNKKIITISEAIIGAGDWIGMVEFLEDCPRLNTFVTLKPCEILSITDDDFNKIMGPFMKKEWQEKKMALKSLNYFDFLTDDQIVRACNYSALIEYNPLQTIYSEDRGAISCVHFILSGECVILQCLKMKMLKKARKTTYELTQADPIDANLFEMTSKSSKSLSSIFHHAKPQGKLLSNSYFVLDDLLDSSSETDEETLQKKKALRKMGLREIELACGLGNPIGTISRRKPSYRMVKKRRTTTIISKRSTASLFNSSISKAGGEEPVEEDEDEIFFDEDMFEKVHEEYLAEEMVTESDIELNDSYRSSAQTASALSSQRTSSKRSSSKSTKYSSYQRSSVKSNSLKKKSISSGTSSKSKRKTLPLVRIADGKDNNSLDSENSSSESAESEVAPITETHFIDVGSVSYGGLFGLGEKMAHRVIMARTVVQCLLLPRYWLMEEEQNPGNVWQRRKFYLEGSIPSREELFGNFLKTRRWEKFKRDYVQSTLNPNSGNSTQPEDIPIISRIVETRDDI